jgi:hypothetical protein
MFSATRAVPKAMTAGDAGAAILDLVWFIRTRRSSVHEATGVGDDGIARGGQIGVL